MGGGGGNGNLLASLLACVCKDGRQCRLEAGKGPQGLGEEWAVALTHHTQPVYSSPGSFRRDHGSSSLPGALEWSPDWTYSQEMCLSLCELLAPVSFMPEEVGLNGA